MRQALFACLKGWQPTAPGMAVRWLERARFVNEHPGWTYRDYDAADAGDILLDDEYHAMRNGLHAD